MLELEKEETMVTDLSDVEWEQPAKRHYNNSPTVRIVKYNGTGTSISFNEKAVDMILGRQQDCHIVLGLSRDRKDLYIKMANPEDAGSRRIQKGLKTSPKWNAKWLGSKLGLHLKNAFGGELVMMNRDMFIVELIESEKQMKKSHPLTRE